MATTITLEQWLELQKVRLMARFPFYGILLSYMRLVSNPVVEVAATDCVSVNIQTITAPLSSPS